MATDVGEKTYLSHSSQELDDGLDEIPLKALQADLSAEIVARQESDAALSEDVETKVNSLDVYKGTEITAGTDLNTLMTPGTYWCASSTVAQTLYNCPISGAGFILQVFTTGNRVAVIYQISAGILRIYMRCFTGGSSGSWKSWYMYESMLSENQGTPPPETAGMNAVGGETA